MLMNENNVRHKAFSLSNRDSKILRNKSHAFYTVLSPVLTQGSTQVFNESILNAEKKKEERNLVYVELFFFFLNTIQ